MENFKQSNFFKTNEIVFQENGINCIYSELMVERTEFFIPYEEIEFEKVSNISRINRLRVVITFFTIIAVIKALSDERAGAEAATFISLLLVSGLFIWWTIAGRKRLTYISTQSMGKIELFSHRPDKNSVDDFVQQLSQKVKAYHKAKYGYVDSDMPTEQQLLNFKYLLTRNMITEEEFNNLKEQLLKGKRSSVIGFKTDEGY